MSDQEQSTPVEPEVYECPKVEDVSDGPGPSVSAAMGQTVQR